MTSTENTSTSTTMAPKAEQQQKCSSSSTSPSQQELDLAFCCDCTGSMGSYIKSAQDNIRQIASSIHAKTAEREGGCSLRFSLVKYRDHPPQDSTFVTEVFPFTEHLELMKRHVDTMEAAGGGDGPEAVAAALHEVNTLGWRPNATKVVVLISDAPPHGLGESGDGFPQGCPLGHDPVKISKDMAAKGITVYAVGVEPVLSTSYTFARDFMMMVANITDGKFLPLGKASVLTDVVVNGTLEGADMKQMWQQLEAETEQEAKSKGIKLNTEELVMATGQRLEAQKEAVVLNQIDVSNPYMANYDDYNCAKMTKASSLAEARSQLDGARNAKVAQQSAGYNWGAQTSACAPQPMQQQQQQRMVQQAQKSNAMFHY